MTHKVIFWNRVVGGFYENRKWRPRGVLVKAKGFTKGWETLIKKSLNEDRRSPLFSCSLAPCCPFTGIVCSFLRSCLHAVEVFILLPFALAFLMLPIRYAPWSCSLFPSVPCSSLFFVSCTMSSSATEDGSPIWGSPLWLGKLGA